ncbi:hypothetical protein BJ742DRAFT_830830 [Cladochytrium replicatum]|nr:hypothetical protein BJ742DRAFT_830830 [Cladochytrium replicatum]
MDFLVLFKKTQGTLRVDGRSLKWYRGAGASASAPDYEIPYQKIKSQAQTPAGSGKILLKLTISESNGSEGNQVLHFASEADRERVKTVIAEQIIKLGQGAPPLTVGSSSSSPQSQSTSLTRDEIESRIALLKANKDLAKLHKELVGGKLINEEEFWESRKQELLNQTWQTKQKRGASSILVNIQASGNEDTNVTYTVTPELIYSIFVQYPAVREAYEQNVPDKIPQSEFWKRYFTSQYFHRTRTAGATTSGQAPGAEGDDLFAKYDYADQDDAAPIPKKLKIGPSTPLLDLSTTAENVPETFGNEPDVTMRAGRQTAAMKLIRSFNRHSEIVVKNKRSEILSKDRSTVEAEPAKLQMNAEKFDELLLKETELEDLEIPEEPPRIPLQIKDPSKYFESQSSGNSTAHNGSSNGAYARQELRKLVSSWRPNLPAVAPSSKHSHEIVRQLNSSARKRKMKVVTSTNASFDSQFAELHAYACELLRHLWSALTMLAASGASVERVAKADRMMHALATHVQKMRVAIDGKVTGDGHGRAEMVSQRATFYARSDCGRSC